MTETEKELVKLLRADGRVSLRDAADTIERLTRRAEEAEAERNRYLAMIQKVTDPKYLDAALTECGVPDVFYSQAELDAALAAERASHQQDRELAEHVLNTSCETWERISKSTATALAAERAKVERFECALAWLDGSAPDHDGKWFGEVMGERISSRPYWWRSHIRKMLTALSPSPSPVEEEGEKRPRCRDCADSDGFCTDDGRNCGFPKGHPLHREETFRPEGNHVDAQSYWSGVGHYYSLPAQQAGAGENAKTFARRLLVAQTDDPDLVAGWERSFDRRWLATLGFVIKELIEPRASPSARDAALEEAIRRTRTRLEHYCNEANAGRMPSDAREFMRRIQCGFDSLFEEACTLRSRQQGE